MNPAKGLLTTSMPTSMVHFDTTIKHFVVFPLDRVKKCVRSEAKLSDLRVEFRSTDFKDFEVSFLLCFNIFWELSLDLFAKRIEKGFFPVITSID